MRISLSEIAKLTGGELAGDAALTVTGVAPLAEAGPGDLTFAREEFLDRLPACRGAAALVPRRAAGAIAQIVVPDPYLAFVRVLQAVERDLKPLPSGVHPSAVVEEGAELGEAAGLGPCAVVGKGSKIGARTVVCANATIGPGCRIGPDCVIHSGVAVRERVVIGARTVIHNNTTIGGDGFGYLQVEGCQVKVPQVGSVEIGDDVEIGCNCTIDRGTLGNTVIGNGVKMDNHCHIAHNCRIGDHSVLVAFARMGGSTVLGRNVLLAEDVGITDHVTLGDRCVVTATARVSKSWPAGSVIGGAPAMEFERAKRLATLQRKLPWIMDRIREIRERLGMT